MVCVKLSFHPSFLDRTFAKSSKISSQGDRPPVSPIKEAKETMHASLVYVKGMYRRNAVKDFFKRMQIGEI